MKRARDPVFFGRCGVADSVDGRFDLLVLHAWLVLDRLRKTGEDFLAQEFVDLIFARFEEGLREQGAGDVGMSRRMKKMASAFYGRLSAYAECADEARLASAILRNVYRGDPLRLEQATALAKYALEARARIAGCRLGEGQLEFGPAPAH